MADIIKTTDTRVVVPTAPLLVGTETPLTGYHGDGQIQIDRVTAGHLLLHREANNIGSAVVEILKRRSGWAAVQNGDRVLTLSGSAADGVDAAHVASIWIEVDGTPGNNDMPGRIIFLTSPDGSEAAAESFRINSAQNIVVADGKRIEADQLRARDSGGLALYDDAGSGVFVEDGGQVGIGNTNPGAALEVTGRVKIRGTSTDPDWSEDGQLALKTGSGDGFLGVTFHEDDGTRVASLQASAQATTLAAGEEAGSADLHFIANDVLRLKINNDGKVGIGGYDTLLARPVLGQFHVIGDFLRTGFLFAESPSALIGPTPVVLIDYEDYTGVGVNVIAYGFVLIRSSDGVFTLGTIISVKNATTQVVQLDSNNSVTFEVVNNSCQLTVYRSAGDKAYSVSFMGMYT